MPNFNNYPYGYNPYMQYQQQQTQQQNSGLTWVQGVEGAKSYYINPGQSVMLMDSESNCFFIKAADASGMPLPLRIFDYTERTAQNAQKPPVTVPVDTDRYITREEFESRITAITAQLKEGVDDAERTV